MKFTLTAKATFDAEDLWDAREKLAAQLFYQPTFTEGEGDSFPIEFYKGTKFELKCDGLPTSILRFGGIKE